MIVDDHMFAARVAPNWRFVTVFSLRRTAWTSCACSRDIHTWVYHRTCLSRPPLHCGSQDTARLWRWATAEGKRHTTPRPVAPAPPWLRATPRITHGFVSFRSRCVSLVEPDGLPRTTVHLPRLDCGRLRIGCAVTRHGTLFMRLYRHLSRGADRRSSRIGHSHTFNAFGLPLCALCLASTATPLTCYPPVGLAALRARRIPASRRGAQARQRREESALTRSRGDALTLRARRAIGRRE